MMKRIHPDLPVPISLFQYTVFGNAHFMPRHISRVLIPEMMFKTPFFFQILIQGSAAGHIHDLNATADPEDRLFLFQHKISGNRNILLIPHGHDCSAISFRKRPIPFRSHIMSAGDQHSVQLVQKRLRRLQISILREQHRNRPGFFQNIHIITTDKIPVLPGDPHT